MESFLKNIFIKCGIIPIAFVLFFALALFLSANAFAQTTQTTSTQTQNSTNDDLSNINGHPVPVGELNRYYHHFNRWNIWTNPFGYFFGSFNVGASYALNENIKANVSPTFIYFYPATPKVVGGGGTLSASIFFKKVYDGFYLEPGGSFLYLSQDRKTGGNVIKGWVGGPQLIAGWGWIWDSGFNINAGLGIGYDWGQIGKDLNDTDAFEGVIPVGNLQFGFTF